jgi:hypothetical protein
VLHTVAQAADATQRFDIASSYTRRWSGSAA